VRAKDVVTIEGFAKEVGEDVSDRYCKGFREARESAYAVGRVVGRESAIHALTAARFGPETADRVVELAGSIDEAGYHSGMGISTAARIGICVLTSATADDLLARVREAIEEESNRAGWADAARELVDHRDDGLLDDPIPTVFDESEWEWE